MRSCSNHFDCHVGTTWYDAIMFLFPLRIMIANSLCAGSQIMESVRASKVYASPERSMSWPFAAALARQEISDEASILDNLFCGRFAHASHIRSGQPADGGWRGILYAFAGHAASNRYQRQAKPRNVEQGLPKIADARI